MISGLGRGSLVWIAMVELCACNSSTPAARELAGSIWQLPDDAFVLQVYPRGKEAPRLLAQQSAGALLVASFAIPAGVQLASGYYRTRADLQSYLVGRYLAPIVPPQSPPANPPPAQCETTPGPGQQDPAGGRFSEPPRIMFVLPSAASASIPVVIVGSSFDEGAIPFINGVSATPLFNVSTVAIPFVGSMTTGTTLVPAAAPPGPGGIALEFCGRRSASYSFTVN